MTKDPLICIDDIQDSIKAIFKYTKGLSKDEFLASTLVQDAVCRRFEIIGEAAKKLSDSFREENSEIPWPKIIAMRNLLIHDYGRVNLEVIWDTIKKHLRDLENSLNKLH